MPTIFTEGDMFADPTLQAFAFGCTTQGKLDAGVAVAFKKQFPGLEDEYKKRCEDGRFSLGDVLVHVDGARTVYALALQTHWKSKAKLAALERSLARTVELATHAGITRIGIPRIGTGLGGLEWRRVKSVAAEIGSTTPIELTVFEKFVRGLVLGEPSVEDA